VERRGGWRPRRHVVPGEVPVWASGRWGPRRARVGQCAGILPAELVYHTLVCDDVTLAPGWRASLSCTTASGLTFFNIDAEVVRNAVWRRGRFFFRCPACQRRATRLYKPTANVQPRCRRCWGLSYESQSWSSTNRPGRSALC